MPLHTGRGTADELLAFQRLAWSSLVLSVTRRCPLRCAHCITSSGPDVESPSVSAARALEWAAELPALAADGLQHLTFTGGEPILAIDAVEILARAARPLRIRTAVVTSAAWASTPATAGRIARRLEPVSHWDIGFDEYHEAEMGWQRLEHAVQALGAAGASFSLRVCEGPDPARTDVLVARLGQLAGSLPVIMRQPVRQLGRSEAQSRTGAPAAAGPCPSSGAFVREDGRAGPCCSGLAYEPAGTHPFEHGNAGDLGLREVWKRWREDQLLRMLRLVGFDVVRQWLVAEGMPIEDVPAVGGCEGCVQLWRRVPPDRAAAVARRAQAPEVRERLDALERHLYGTVA